MKNSPAKTILITGSNRGIGYEIAKQCAAKGFHVILSGRDFKKLTRAQAQLRDEGYETLTLVMDVSDPLSMVSAAHELQSKKIKLDVLINNAAIGMSSDRKIVEGDEKVLDSILLTNGFGPLRVVNAFLKLMKTPSRIIMISSGGGAMSEPAGGWWPAYCISKTFLNAVTRFAALELRDRNIAVNAVCPGWVKTDMGGSGAYRSVEKGAETPVWLATDAPQSHTGKFFRDKREIPW